MRCRCRRCAVPWRACGGSSPGRRCSRRRRAGPGHLAVVGHALRHLDLGDHQRVLAQQAAHDVEGLVVDHDLRGAVAVVERDEGRLARGGRTARASA